MPILPAVTAPFAIVAEKLPVPLPVTSPVSVIVWSPVFVPLEVPENVPLCVARVPRPSAVRAPDAVVAPVPPCDTGITSSYQTVLSSVSLNCVSVGVSPVWKYVLAVVRLTCAIFLRYCKG